MMRSFAKLLGRAVLCVGVSSALAQTPVPAPAPQAAVDFKHPAALLKAARATNGLEGDDLKPWHLKATYEVFDDSGNISGTGLFEEWRADANHWKLSYTSRRVTQTEYQTTKGHFYGSTAGAAPWPESLIEKSVVHPLPAFIETVDTQAELTERKFSGTRLACIMFAQPEEHAAWPLGLFPTYCFGRESSGASYGNLQ